MLSRLTLPPPHRLSRRAPPRGSSVHCPSEETDSAPPAAKRPRTVRAPQHAKSGHDDSREHTPPIAQTYNGKPLKKFSLHLPRCLPASIATDGSALASFTLTSTATYLQLWNFDKNMDSVDIRLPEEYSNLPQNRSRFLPRFLEAVFGGLGESGVKSVKKLIVPTSRLPDLIPILNALQTLTYTLKNVFIPLSNECTQSDLTYTVASEITKAATAVTTTIEITLVSSSPELSKILADIKTGCGGKTSIKFSSLSSEGTGSPVGPEYLADLEKTEPQGELVDPQSLISSLNTATFVSSGGEDERSSRKDGGSSWTGRTTEPKRVRPTFSQVNLILLLCAWMLELRTVYILHNTTVICTCSP